MKAPLVVCSWIPAQGMAVFPVILLKSRGLKRNEILINHEKIHLRQQLEMLVLPFYVLYFLLYSVNRLRGMKHYEAYRNIAFEKEAFSCDNDLNYLSSRPPFAWVTHLRNTYSQK